MRPTRIRQSLRLGAAILALASAVACASGTGRNSVPAGTSEPDKWLFERGTAKLNDKKWLDSREYFKRLVETYTQSQFRPDAKIGVGDTYLGERTPEALVLAANEYREFLTFYPTHSRADYAQYKLGLSHYLQMRAAQRDQTETREAIKELNFFVERYPDSALMSEVQGKLRECRDRLDEADYAVGLFYYRNKWYPGAIDRFQSLLKADPDYSFRDATYYYLAESLLKVKRDAEALPYYQRLVDEFQSSDYLRDAQKRMDELKNPRPAEAAKPAKGTAQ